MNSQPTQPAQRLMPPLNTDERTTLESWLDFHRATLAIKCQGLDDQQAATATPTCSANASTAPPAFST